MPEQRTQTSEQTSLVDDLAAEYGEVRSEEQLDWPKLQGYLREHEVPGASCAMEVKQFRGGSSNLTYLLRFADGHQWVVRRAPAVRTAAAFGPRYGARIPSTVAVMGGIRGSAPRDRAVRGYFDHRRKLLR